jgi:Ca2+-binding RTX toxin-like protein
MAKQTTPKTTLTGAASVNLSALDPSNYYNATLTGSYATGRAHSPAISTLLSALTGDTLVATGNNTTLYGGAGKDSLVALGSNDYLIAGTGADTLLGTTIVGATDTLVGNGLSSLVGRGANDTFVLSRNGDKIISSLSGGIALMQGKSSTILTSINNFSLTDTTNHGTGVAFINKLVYTGSGGATLTGNALADTIIGNTLSGGNFISAGTGTNADSLVGGSGNDTLQGNGRSTLNGGAGIDTFYVTAQNGATSPPGDTILETGANGLVVVKGNGTYDLGKLGNQAQGISTLRSDGSGSFVTLIGNNNANGNLIVGTNMAGGRNSLVAGNGSYTATLVASSTGNNTLIGNAGIDSIVAGAGNDFISLASASALAKDTVSGGLGTDTLVLGAGTASDAAFRNVSGTEVLSLASSSYVTLGGYAQSLAGISTVIAGSGPDLIDASGYTTSLTIDASADIANADNLTGSGTASTTFILGSASALAASTVTGGNKSDILVVNAGDLADASFVNVRGVEALSLGATSTVTLGSAAKNSSISQVLGGNGVYQNVSGNFTLQRSNSYTLGSAAYLASDTISGGTGSSTLQIASSANLGTNALTNVSNIGTLKLTSNSAVTLDAAAQNAGIQTVIGGTGNDSFTQLATNSTSLLLDGSRAGKGDSFSLNALGASTVKGGAGIDSLLLNAAIPALKGTNFANVSSVEYLGLTSATAITLDSGVANAGISTIVGGTGSDSFTDDGTASRSFYITGSAASADLFTVTNSSRIGLGGDTILGNGGTDTLAFSQADTNITDTAFKTVSSVEVLTLTGGSSIALASYAKAAHVSTIIGGTGSDTIDASSFAGSLLLDGSRGTGDLFLINAAQFAAGNDTVTGGTGSDTLLLATATPSVADASFAKIKGVEVLQLSSPTSITMGSNAAASGITTVITGDGSDTVIATGYTPALTNLFTIDASANFSGGNLLRGSNAVANEFLFSNAVALANSTVQGGAGTDTLAFTDLDDFSDTSFRHVTGIEVLSLSSDSAVTLDAFGAISGIKTVVGGDGSDTITQGVNNSNNLSVDLSAGLGGLFAVNSSSQLRGDTFVGSDSDDTLFVIGADRNITDTSFAHVTSAEFLQLTSSSSVTLGGTAQTAGISTVYGGNGGDTFTQSATNTSYALTLVADAGSNLFSLDNGGQLSLDSLVGGTETDTLSISNGADLADNLFAQVTGMELLSLSGSSSVTLGTYASDNYFSTIIGGSGSTTLVQDAANTNALRLDGSAGSSDYIALTSDQLIRNVDTIIGGTGVDTLAITTADTNITDTAFQGVSSMEVLSLTSDITDGSSSVTLGSFAKASGIGKAVGGTGNDTFIRDTLFTGGLTLDGSKGSGDLFQVDASQLSSTTLIGGSTGLDTLSISSRGNINLNSAANIINVPLIQLTGQSGLTLGSGVSGISTIVTANAADTVDGSQYNGTLTIDATALDNPFTYTIPGGQLLKGASAYGTDFLLSSTTALRNSTLVGGTGTDTLAFTPAGVTLNDDDFQNLGSSSIEVLGVTANSSVMLGGFAAAAGIRTLVGSNGNDTFDVSADNLSVYIDGTAGAGDSYVIDSSRLLASGGNTISGGSGGSDTLSLVTPDTNITDVRFAAISNVGTLILPDASSVTLGAAMQTAGISTVIGANGGDTFTQSAGYTHAAYLQGGNGNNLFSISTTAQLTADVILGGSASDTLQLSQGGAIADSAFGGVSGIEILSLASGSNVTLGAAAASTDLSTIVGGGGSCTFTQTVDNDQALLINGLADTSNVFNLTSNQLEYGDDTIIGAGADTLNITTPNNQGTDVTDQAFANLSGISVLALTSPIAVTLGSQSQYTGIQTVIGGVGSDSITVDPSNTGSITLDGSHGSGDLFAFTSSSQLTGTTSSVLGGNGSDTLLITGADTNITDALFTHLRGVEVLQIAGSSAVTLEGNASLEGLKRIVTGSAGNDTVSATSFNGTLAIDASTDTNSGSNLMLGGAAGTTFLVANSTVVLPSDTVTGGSGIDTLTITSSNQSLVAGSFQHVTGIEALSLTGNSSITVDSLLADTALAAIYGGTGSSTFTDNGFNTGLRIDASNGSGSSFKVLTSSRLGSGKDTLIGNSSRSDTLTISNTDSGITDNAFQFVTSVDNLVIAGSGSKAILGSYAGTAGITTVSLNGGNDTLVQTASNTTALLIDGTARSNNRYEIASSVKLGAGLDTIRGSGITDTLAIATQESVSDQAFAQISRVGLVSLTGASTVNLGTNANTAGFTTVLGGANGSNGTTFIQTQIFTNGISLVGNAGNDTFRLSDATLLGRDSLYGSGGTTDALQITSATSAIADSSFSNVRGIEILSLTGASKALLGANANTDGLASVFGGLGNSTLTQQATFTNGLTLVGGSGNYNDLFSIGQRSYLTGGKDSIIGNGGIDTLVLSEATTYSDSDFQYVNGVKALSLTGASALTLDTIAKSAGLANVYGGAGNSTFTQNSGANQLLTIVGGNGNDSFSIASAVLTTDSILGGSGSDTLQISTAGTIADTSFAKISGVEAVSLTGASTVTLDLNARKAGIATISGGAGATTITQTANETNALTLVGGNGNYADSFTIANATLLANDSIAGGAGTDTLVISAAASINNGFSKVSGIEALSLTGASSVTLGGTGQTAGISTVIGGSGTTILNAAAYTTAIRLDNNASSAASSLLSGTGSDTLLGGTVADTLQAWSGSAASNTASDTLTGGSGNDWFIMAKAGDSKNAYGNGGTNVATITDFAAGTGADKLQLHEFGTGHVGSAGYQTVSGGAGIIDIYNYNSQTAADHVAHLTGVTGSFSWTNNASFI